MGTVDGEMLKWVLDVLGSTGAVEAERRACWACQVWVSSTKGLRSRLLVHVADGHAQGVRYAVRSGSRRSGLCPREGHINTAPSVRTCDFDQSADVGVHG